MATTDILITPARIYYAPVGETLPDSDSVGYGEAWGGNWVDVGYTLTPLSMNFDRTTFKLFVEQLTNPVRTKITEETLAAETTLAELTGDNLVLGFGGTVVDSVADADSPAKSVLEMGGDVTADVYAWGFEGEYVTDDNDSLPVRVFLFRGAPILGGSLEFAKAAAVGIPIRIEAEADTDKAVGKQLMKIEICTAIALGT
jgi:hypothetical protein